jgi:hypothetical protein
MTKNYWTTSDISRNLVMKVVFSLTRVYYWHIVLTSDASGTNYREAHNMTNTENTFVSTYSTHV